MESLAMDPGGYTGSYKLIGGRMSLDLVNTVSWPTSDREHDWLTTTANLATWIDAVGLTKTPISNSDLAEFHDVRSVLAEMLRPLAHGRRPARASGERFNKHLARALARRRVDSVDLVWTWKPARRARDVLDPVLIDAADIITQGDHGRLRHCPSCGWLFEDQTRNGGRRWCDMADCGSRAKARSYYRRSKN